MKCSCEQPFIENEQPIRIIFEGGKLFSREVIFKRSYFQGKLFSREVIFKGSYFQGKLFSREVIFRGKLFSEGSYFPRVKLFSEGEVIFRG